MSKVLTIDYRRFKRPADMDPSAPPSYFELDNSSLFATKRSFGGNGTVWVDGKKYDVRITVKGTFDLSSERGFQKSPVNSFVYSFKRIGAITLSGFNSRLEDLESELESIYKVNNKIYGSKFNDKLIGHNGRDTINGGSGNDKIYGGNGHDTINGGRGVDKIYGGNGLDMLNGGSGNDKIYGGQNFDLIEGGKGADLISGGKGTDAIFGDEGNDKIFGGDGDDSLYGGEGDDKIYGGKGDDLINGGNLKKTVNRVWGNSGRDTFVIDDGAYGTVIQDFNVTKDRIGVKNLRDWRKKYSWEIRGKNTFIDIGDSWQAKLIGKHDLSLAIIVEV